MLRTAQPGSGRSGKHDSNAGIHDVIHTAFGAHPFAAQQQRMAGA
ncbi:hypothetical protein [Noviherbaspirillum cavernae]|nr:hypothetical protein [Noviherbaspirillum cavernae]